MEILQAWVTNLGKYNEGVLACEPLTLPTSTEKVQALLKRIGVDSVRYEETFIADYHSDIPGLCQYLGEYESIDELNHLACLIAELSPAELEMLEAAVDKGDHMDSAKELINLVHNLDCYSLYPDIEDEDDLGRYYLEDGVLSQVPEFLRDYIDYESYGRAVMMEEDGSFVRGGYVLCDGSFQEVYQGRGDIPEEHRVFSYPKLTIREKLDAYKEVTGRVATDNTRPAPEQGHDDR